MLVIITRGTKSKFQLTIGVFSIAFAMSMIEKVAEFLNADDAIQMLNKHCCNDYICASLSLLRILLSEYLYYVPIR